ncbi:ATP-binding Cassette (ABC) Superfamily [Thraustotheca clavata]|uniref:ATP-binding Cassette (ABC) Superfamily n=1 Tax=Thraustotheca clavata TaxID=74557 RepID=A0A1W0A1D0_9STRA|nr:ATP-binding Cassette (ABC) Superfamily [Thraustotheca clavata]
MAKQEDFVAYLKALKESNEAGIPIEVCMKDYCKKKKQGNDYVLYNISATFRPGTMTLILGPPGCGKTSLLKAISGAFNSNRRKISGSVSYNGLPSNKFQLKQLVTFVGQKDEHIPTLTVQETIEFAHTCRSAANEDGKASAKAIIDALGLRGCTNTIVGNDMIRGISGGQKRRVTIAEMLTGKQSIVLLDEYSTGLDTTVALDITRKLRDMCTLLQYTLVCSLLQPPPEVYELFDNVILLNSGHVAYMGPREQCGAYFKSIGYIRPPRVDEADFLQEVTTELGQSYISPTAEAEGLKIPVTAAEFQTTFTTSSFFKVPNPSSSASSSNPWKPKTKRSFHQQFAMVFSRQFKLVKRDTRFNRVRVGQNIMFGLIIGSLFWQLGFGSSSVPSKVGLVFLTILFTSVTTISNIAYTIEVRNIFHKQSRFDFYPALAYSVSEGVIEVIASSVQVVLFTITSYWMCGFTNASNSGTEYGYYYFMVFLNSCCICQLFKAVSSMANSATSGVSLASGLIFLEILFSGFAILYDVMPAGLSWIYWVNPGSWTFRALLLNEYSSTEAAYDIIQPAFHMRVGDYYLTIYGVSTDTKYLNTGVIYLIGFYMAAILLATLGYTFVRPTEVHANKNHLKCHFHIKKEHQHAVMTQVNNIAQQHPVEFTPTSLSFRNLYYTVQIPHKKKEAKAAVSDIVTLLQDIHGHCKPYTLTALMGSSGAGKSTLLDVLAGRKNTGQIKGDLFVNGQVMTKLDQKRFGYVEQTDIHCLKTTVEEAFLFSARLRLPESAQRNTQNIVQSTIHLLELTTEAKKMLNELSNEQMKRLTIGVELVANPSVLFLDEPTSGLDVHAAQIVMVAVKRIAAAGRTVICTIHQPSLSLFELFDELILLQTGGRTVYCGPIGQESCDLISHFQALPNIRKCNPAENPATYMLDVLATNPSTDFHQIYLNSDMRVFKIKTIDSLTKGATQELSVKSTESTASRSGYAQPYWQQFFLLLIRTGKKYWRSKDYTIGRLAVGIFVSILLGILCSTSELKYTTQIQSQMGICFIFPMFMGIISINTGLPVVDAERMVYFRETSSGMYATFPYSIVLGLVEIPLVIFNSIIHVCIFYYSIGLNTDNTEAFPWFLLIFFLYNLYATYFGQLLVVTVPDLSIATAVAGASASIFSIFSGFFIHYDSIPTAWRFLYWISPLHYVLEGIFSTQFLLNNKTIYVGSASKILSPTPIPVSTYVDTLFGGTISYSNRGYDAMALIIWIIVIRIGHILSQKYLNQIAR